MVVDTETQAPQAANPDDDDNNNNNNPVLRVRTKLFPNLRALATSAQRAVVLQSQLLWQKRKQPFQTRRAARPRTRRGHGRDGVSIGMFPPPAPLSLPS